MLKRKTTLRKRTKAILSVAKENKHLSSRNRTDMAMSLKANRKIFDKGAGSPTKARKLKKGIALDHLKWGSFVRHSL